MKRGIVVPGEWTPSGAIFSEDRKFRYVLWRIWNSQKPKVMFIGLNPSKAGEVQNDATIRRIMRFAQDHDFGGAFMLNLFPCVTTNPKLIIEDNVQENDIIIREIASQVTTVVFCWGNFPRAQQRAKDFIKAFGIPSMCLGRNKNGTPKHPCRLAAKTKFVPY
jgi:hypothetical protein